MKKLALGLGIAVVLTAGIFWWLRTTAVPAGPYNLLLITLDTTRADRLGCYGHEQAVTPALDGLAAAGTRFEQAFTTIPLTLPSHTTLLTGLFPPEHGLKINGTKQLPGSVTTLAEIFQSAGYDTGAFVAAFALDSRFGLDQGFDTYDDDLAEAYAQGRRDTNSVYRSGNLVTDAALSWLTKHHGRPFFCWVHFYDPHKPYHPHEELTGTRFAGQSSYDAEITFMDQQVARLRNYLDAHHLADRTLVVAVADHGEGLGQHGETEHGYMLYDTTVRVPMIFALPGIIRPGLRVKEPVSLVDFFPTVLELVGMDSQEGRRGRSLADALRGKPLEPKPCYAETDLPYAYFGWGPQRSLITEEWKYIRSPRTELYDRRADPHETRNLASRKPDLVNTFDAILTDLESAMERRQATDVKLDTEEQKRLRALGYVGGGREIDSETLTLDNLKDIKDMLPVIDRMWRMFELVELGQLTQAEKLCREMVEQSPESPRLQCYLADVLNKQENFQEALPHYAEALRLDPQYTDAYVNMGLVLGRLGQHEQAALHLRQAVAIDPRNAEAHYNLGIALMRQNKNDEAISSFSQALRLQPDDKDARVSIGLLLARKGEYEDALRHLRVAARNDPKDPGVRYNLGAVLAHLERYAEAEQAYRKALEIHPNAPRTRNNLGVALARQGKIEEAVSEYRQTLRLDPKHLGAMSNLAWILATSPREDLRDGPEAVTFAEKAAAALDQPDVRTLDVLAAALAEAGRFEEAVETIKQAIALSDDKDGRAQNSVEDLRERLALYQSGKPYRQPPYAEKKP